MVPKVSRWTKGNGQRDHCVVLHSGRGVETPGSDTFSELVAQVLNGNRASRVDY